MGTYSTGDAALSFHISSTDLLNGLLPSTTMGGYHSASVPATDSARSVTLTDGAFATNGLSVIASDSDAPAVPGPTLILEYTLAQPTTIGEIIIYAGHDSNGDRAWINAKVEVFTGSGYTTLSDHFKTGAYGQAKPNNSMVSLVRMVQGAGQYLATNASKIRFSFYNGSHNSLGAFKAYDNNGPPENQYPNQGTILKEIDVFAQPPATSVTPNVWNKF